MDAEIAHGLHYVVLFSAYAVLWFLSFFCMLPIGLGDVDPETGAPLDAYLGRKALWATGIAVLLWVAFYAAVGFGWLEI